MKEKADSTFATYSALKGVLKRTSWRQFYCILASLNCALVLAAFSMTQRAHSASLSQASQLVAQDQSSKAPKSHDEVDLSSKNPDELAAYVFEHHHCDTCHTLGK